MKRMMCLFPMMAVLILLTSTANSQMGASSNTNGSLGIEGINEELPSNATLINKGEVVSINQEDHTVSVHDSGEGVTNVYTITNKKMLDSINQGDSIKIFSQPGAQK